MKKLSVFIAIVCTTWFIFLGYSSYQMFYPFKTLVINHIGVKTQEIKAGDTFIYTVDYCKYTNKPANVYRTLHAADESVSVPFPSVTTISIPGCHVTDVPLETYASIQPGTYYMLADVVFKMSPQRDIHVTFRTDNFLIR